MFRKDTDIDYHDQSWYDAGSQLFGQAVTPPNAEYYAIQIKDATRPKFELRLCSSALKNTSCGISAESVYKWLWYTSLLIWLEMDDAKFFHTFYITANDVKDGKLTKPWSHL